MKKSRRICWLLAGTLIFAGIILWAGDATYGEGGGKGQGITYFCLGGGLLIGLLLAIEWLVEFQKSFSLLETNDEKARKRKDLCKQGLYLLQRRDKAKTIEGRGNWNSQWGTHRKKCPFCGRAKG